MKQTKHYRRILAAILAAVLTVGMSLTAFATDENPSKSSETDKGKGSITITNPQPDVTYKAYKIFDVTYAPALDKTTYSYTIVGGEGESKSPWFDTVKAYADQAGSKLILSPTAGSDTYVVSTEDGFSAANFAKALQAAVTGKTEAASVKMDHIPAEDETLELGTGLDLGYYLIMGTNAGLCSLDTTAPNAEVTDKNDVPFDKKLTGVDDQPITPIDSRGVTVGSKLTYTIEGVVPNTESFTEYVYIAEDTMDVGLTMNQDVKVTINDVEVPGLTADTSGNIPRDEENKLKGNELTKGTVYYKTATPATEDKPGSGGGFVLRLDMKDYEANKGKAVKITYSATVNENAVEVISKNEAKLTYGNNPDDLAEGEPSVVRVFSSSIEVLKYDKKGDPDTLTSRLAGAEFVLKNSTGEGDAVAPGDKYYKLGVNEKTGKTEVTWVDSIDDATHVTTDDGTTNPDKKGLAYFTGLENGTYYLVETKAPTGYNLLGANDKTDDGKITANGEVKVEVNHSIELKDGDWVGVPEDFTAHEKVANSTGSLLPSTGGIGTTIFYVLGSVLLVLAAVWFVISRRRTQTEEK